MPAALEVDREYVKCIAIQVGYREAARQLGLSENTVMAWARRDGWGEQVKQAQQAVEVKQIRQGVHAVARKTPSEVLFQLGDKSKLRAAKVGDNTLRALQKRKPEGLIKGAGAFKCTVDALAKVHGWGSESTVNSPTVALQVNVSTLVPE